VGWGQTTAHPAMTALKVLDNTISRVGKGYKI